MIPEKDQAAFNALTKHQRKQVRERIGALASILHSPTPNDQTLRVIAVAEAFSVNPATVRRYLEAYRKHGWKALLDKTSNPLYKIDPKSGDISLVSCPQSENNALTLLVQVAVELEDFFPSLFFSLSRWLPYHGWKLVISHEEGGGAHPLVALTSSTPEDAAAAALRHLRSLNDNTINLSIDSAQQHLASL